jgi:release factor glutamine methyltransferase
VHTARELIAWSSSLGLPLSEARALISHCLGRSKEWLIVHDDEILTTDKVSLCKEVLMRRANGEPFAYLVGMQEFYGREFSVSPAVLIPRPDTELLIDTVLGRFPKNDPLQIIDLGTGSGCIGITLALERKSWQVLAIDNSPDSLAVAQNNAHLLKASNCNFLRSNWWQAIPMQHFDIVVANPPYIAQHDSHLAQGDLRFEPQDALTDHADGLAAYRIILQGLAAFAHSQTLIFLEHGYDQAQAIAELVTETGFFVVEQLKDLNSQPRLMIARI